MTEKEKHDEMPDKSDARKEKDNLPGYPEYPASEDIYNKYSEEKNISPEDISQTKEPVTDNEVESDQEKDTNEDMPGSDMDVPGSELDDEQESIGNEDEENNYYSLGGDDHSNLDEDGQ